MNIHTNPFSSSFFLEGGTMSRTSASTSVSMSLDTTSFLLRDFILSSSLFNFSLYTLRSSLFLNFSVHLRSFVRNIFIRLFYFTSQSSSHSFYNKFFISFYLFININHLFNLNLSVFILRLGHTFNDALHYVSIGYVIILTYFNIPFLLSVIFFTRKILITNFLLRNKYSTFLWLSLRI